MSSGLTREYTLRSEIGRGRFGVVRQCISKDCGDIFAVKTVDKSLLSGDSVDMKCLELEAKVMQFIGDNVNIVKVYNVYEDDMFVDIVMELCDGGDLFDRVASEGVFDEDKALMVMVPLMEAIAHCHRMGVAHRDIKPDNILFDAYGRLKLADFGSSELFFDGSLMSGVVGTPYYVAPEVLGGNDYNEKVDVWSAGVILHLLLAGVPPFNGETPEEIFDAVLRGNLRFPTRVFGEVSSAAKDLLRKMICRDASRRFSAEQVLNHPWMTEGRSKLANLT